MTRSGSTYYYMADGLGSIRNVVDASETVQNTYDYYAFGNTLGTPTTAVTNPFEYTGREFENGGVNGTRYYRNRYYMSGLGIFMSRDAMWADGHRGWGYVGNGPVVLADPYGLGIWEALQSFWEWLNNKQDGSNFNNSADCPNISTDPDVGSVDAALGMYEKTADYDPALAAQNADSVQEGLGAGGAIPVFGTGFDLANAAVDYVRDDNSQALEDLAWAAVPYAMGKLSDLKSLSKGEIKRLKAAGHDIHDLKGPGKGVDIFKDKKGNLYRGRGYGDPLGVNINELGG